MTRAFSGIPKQKGGKIRIGRLTLAFSGAQRRAEVLCILCVLGLIRGSQTLPTAPQSWDCSNCSVQ